MEATIELDFMKVPAGGFPFRMRGSMTLTKGFYSFIDERCRDIDGVISSTGKRDQKFVAVVSIKDTLRIDFMEETPSQDFLSFKASKHGNKRQFDSTMDLWSLCKSIGQRLSAVHKECIDDPICTLVK